MPFPTKNTSTAQPAQPTLSKASQPRLSKDQISRPSQQVPFGFGHDLSFRLISLEEAAKRKKEQSQHTSRSLVKGGRGRPEETVNPKDSQTEQHRPRGACHFLSPGTVSTINEHAELAAHEALARPSRAIANRRSHAQRFSILLPYIRITRRHFLHFHGRPGVLGRPRAA
ncbi:hypothetical protein FRC20_004479, partial [Serendipita sp. 405]